MCIVAKGLGRNWRVMERQKIMMGFLYWGCEPGSEGSGLSSQGLHETAPAAEDDATE